MRNWFVVVIFLLVVCCQGKPTTRSELLLSENSVGPVKIGQTRDEVLQLLRTRKWKETDWLGEGEVIGTRIEIYDDEDLLFVAEIYKAVVYRLRVISPQVRTREGVGVGSTLGEVKRKLGRPTELLTGEDGLFAIVKFKTGALSFGLEVPEPFEKYAFEETKVSFVLITNASADRG